MRVVHIDAGNMYGGVETLLVTLSHNRELCREMVPEFALCFDGRLSGELEKTGAKVHRLGKVRSRNPLSIFRARKQLAELLSRRPTDVVVCHMPWVHLMFGPVAKSLHVPLVCWLHGTSSGKHWVEKWAGLTTPDLVLCNSNFSAKSVSALFPHAQVRTLYYPVADAREPRDSGRRVALRSELNTLDDSKVIIQVSRLEESKGHMFHLEALAALRDVPGWTCWMVGGPQRADEVRLLARLKDRTKELGISERVRFPGQRSDVAELLAAADIFCQPNSEPEPFGIVFVEAMFAKLPVVTTAMGGPLEIVNDSCGITVRTGDVGGLADALRRLIEDPGLRMRLGCVGRTRAGKLCDVGTQMKELSDLLSALVRTKRPSRGAAMIAKKQGDESRRDETSGSRIGNSPTRGHNRSRLSKGSTNSSAVYGMVVTEIAAMGSRVGTLIDVGCGTAQLEPMVRSLCSRYIGVDVVRYDDFPTALEFVKADLDDLHPIGIPDESGDVVASIETVEHLENPRSLMRELVRLAKPGGLILVTTPNQLSLLSLMTLLVKGQFNQFQEAPGLYPAHITHLLETDMMHIARECGLEDVRIVYSGQGRMPYMARHWPTALRGRWFSDNLMLAASKPHPEKSASAQ